MRASHRDHAVAAEPKPVHPEGHPISASTNSGFKQRGSFEVQSPAGDIARTWRPRRPFTGVFARLVAPSLWSRAVGVIQSPTASQSVTPLWCRPLGIVRTAVRFRPFRPSVTVGVGQAEKPGGVGFPVTFAVGEDEEPLAPVRGADFLRREESRRKAVAHADQSAGDLGKPRRR